MSHFNPGEAEDERLWSQASDLFSSVPTLSFLLFLNMHKIPAVLHFTPNFTCNFLMNSYSASFSLFSDFLHSFLHLSACAWSVSWIIPTRPVGFSYSFILTHSLHLCSLLSGFKQLSQTFPFVSSPRWSHSFCANDAVKGPNRNKARNFSELSKQKSLMYAHKPSASVPQQ